MSPGRLSFSPLQDGPNYNFNTPGPYNASAGNPYGNGNGQFSVPTPPISAWGGNSQTTQEQQYNIHNNNIGQNTPDQSHVQHIQHLQDTVNRLQVENTSLRAECSATQNAYNTLVSHLAVQNSSSATSVAEGPIGVALNPLAIDIAGPLFKRNPPPLLERAKYPSVRFWTEEDWKTWRATTAEGSKSSQYTSFLEDKDGELLTSTRTGDILQTAREILHEFRVRRIIDLDTTWLSMPASAKWNFCDEITRAWPELNLGEDMWKSDMIGRKHYGAFKQTWFTNKTDDKASGSGRRRKVKKESVDSIDFPKSKRARHSPSPSPDVGDSDANGSSTQIPDPISASSASSSSIQSIPLPHTPSIPSSLHYTSPEADDFEQIYDHSGAPGGSMCADVDALGSQLYNDARTPGEKISESESTTSNAASNSVEGAAISNNNIKKPLSTVPDVIAPSVVEGGPMVAVAPMVPPVVRNPLLSMRSKPPVDAAHTQQPISSATPSTVQDNCSKDLSHQMNAGAPLNHTANASTSQSAVQPAPDGQSSRLPAETPASGLPAQAAHNGSEKKKSWRPPSNKSARTLCMHRYHRQIGGSLEEFNTYYEALSAEAKAKYKEETKQLVATGMWIKGTADVIAKFSGLPMY